jgi:hypothetical protein
MDRNILPGRGDPSCISIGLAACPAMNRGEVWLPIIDEARLIVHQFLEPESYDSSKPSR